MDKLRLGVNIDHVATLRNARGAAWPDPLRAALLAEASGADGITAHLREDRRHIRDADMEALRAGIGIPASRASTSTASMKPRFSVSLMKVSASPLAWQPKQ